MEEVGQIRKHSFHGQPVYKNSTNTNRHILGNWISFLIVCLGLWTSSSSAFAETDDTFSLSVYYTNGNTPSCSGSTNLETAKRHGWLYSGYLFHYFLNGVDADPHYNPAAPENQDSLFGIAECDDSYCQMQRIFGYMPGIFYVDGSPACPGSSTKTIPTQAIVINNLLRLLNWGMFSVMLIVTAYALAQGILLGGIQDGSILNQRLTLLSGMRICVGSLILIPLPGTGYSIIQVIMMYVTLMGVGLADRSFSVAIDAFIKTGHVFSLVMSESEEAANNKDTTVSKALRIGFSGKSNPGVVAPPNYTNSNSECTNNSSACWPTSNPYAEGYTDITRRLICAQYQVYSRWLRTNDDIIQLGIDSVSSSSMDISAVTRTVVNGNGVTTVFFGDQGATGEDASDYKDWCGYVVYNDDAQEETQMKELLRQFNNRAFVLFQSSISYSKRFRESYYTPDTGDLESQLQTCMRQAQIYEVSSTTGPTTSANSGQPTCSGSSNKSPEWKLNAVPTKNCSGGDFRPSLLGNSSNDRAGTLQGPLLGPVSESKIPWQGCASTGASTTLNSKTYARCIYNVASDLSSILSGNTDDLGYQDDEIACYPEKYMFIRGQGTTSADALRTNSVRSDADPTACFNADAHSKCYEADIKSIQESDQANGTTYTGSQYDLVKGYRFLDWALAKPNEKGFENYKYNNIYQGTQDYNQPSIKTASVDPSKSISDGGTSASVLDKVAKNLLQPIYNDAASLFTPPQGFIVATNINPSSFNLKQSMLMVIERFLGIYYFDDHNIDGDTYYKNFWEKTGPTAFSELSKTCKDTFNSVCSSSKGCFNAMVSKGCIRNGGLLGAANAVINQINYNPFQDFMMMGNTILRSVAYFLVYNNLEIFQVNAIAISIYYGIEAAIGLANGALAAGLENLFPQYLVSLATQPGYAIMAFFGVLKQLDLTLVQYYTDIAGSLIFIMMPAGFMMGILIPFYPILVFVIGAFGWFVSVLEAMIAAPLVAVGLAHPSYHDLMGKSTQSVLLMFSVFIRPILMVFGVFFAIIMINVMIIFFNTGFLYYISNLVVNLYGSQGLSMSSDLLIVTSVGLVYVYLMLIWEVVSKSCTLMVSLSDTVLRWMDSNFQAQGMSQQADKLIGAAKEATSGFGDATTGALRGVNQTAGRGAQVLASKAATLAYRVGAVTRASTGGILDYLANEEKGGDSETYKMIKDNFFNAKEIIDDLDDKDGMGIGDLARPYEGIAKGFGATNVREELAAYSQANKEIKSEHAAECRNPTGTERYRELKSELKSKKLAFSDPSKTREERDVLLKEISKLEKSIKGRETLSTTKDALAIAKAEAANTGKSQKTREEAEKQVKMLTKQVKKIEDNIYGEVKGEKITQLRQQILRSRAMADPTKIYELNDPHAPKVEMTVGDLNGRMDRLQQELDTGTMSIKSTKDMVAARAAGISWDNIMQNFKNEDGSKGISPSDALKSDRFNKMMVQASKVRSTPDRGYSEKSLAFSPMNQQGEKLANREFDEAFGGTIRTEGTIDNNKLVEFMKNTGGTQETLECLNRMGVSAKQITQALKVDKYDTSNIENIKVSLNKNLFEQNGKKDFTKLARAGYKLKDIAAIHKGPSLKKNMDMSYVLVSDYAKKKVSVLNAKYSTVVPEKVPPYSYFKAKYGMSRREYNGAMTKVRSSKPKY